MRRLARLVALVAAVGVAWLLFGEGPKEVVLVYDVAPPGATRLEVELRRAGEVVRRADFRLPPPGGTVRHEVRLPDGVYALGWRVTTPSGAREGERTLAIHEAGTIVLAVGR